MRGTCATRCRTRFAELPEEELQSALRQLCAAELIFGRGQPPDAVYAFKHVLVPVWVLAFNYRTKVYQVLVNGYSGTIAGDYPLSPWKIFLLIVVIVIVAAIVIIFGQE